MCSTTRRSSPDRIYLTQPLGRGRVADYTWAQVLDQSRRMAAHLQSRGFPRGARIAILSKNCAHFIMAELAIWMAGYTTVAIFPTETAETIGYVLGHSEASLLFVGKLDSWDAQKPGVAAAAAAHRLPAGAPTARARTTKAGTTIIARTAPLAGRAQRAEDELAMIIYTSGSTGRPKGAMISFGAIIARRRGHRRRLAQAHWRDHERRPHPVVPAAGAQLRALLGRGRVAGRRQDARVLRRVAGHLPAGPAARPSRRCSSACRGCG